MNATNHFLDLLAESERKAGRRSADYALSKILGCGSPVIYHYRAGARHLSESHCMIVAQRLGVDPLQVFAAINAERTKDGTIREFWERTAKRAARVAVLVAGVMVAQGAAQRAEASEGFGLAREVGTSRFIECAQFTRRRRRGKSRPH